MPAAPTHRRRLGAASDLAISADSRLLAATTSRTVVLHDLVSGRRLAAARLSNAASVDFSPQTDRLVVTTTGGEQRLYTVPGLDQLVTFSGEGIGEGAGALFGATGRRTIQATWSGIIVVREDDREVHRDQLPPGWMCHRMVRDPTDGRLLIAASTRHGVPGDHGLFAVDGDGRRSTALRTELPSAHLTVSGTGLIATGERGAVVVRDRDGREHARRVFAENRSLGHLAFSPDGQELLAIEDEIRPQEEILADIGAIMHGTAAPPVPKTVQAYDADLEPTWSMPLAYASDAAYSPDGRTLVLGSWERGLVLDR